ncbi:porin family protein [Pedobacter endophyticus]|uniref:PorT family protein n=1 Tax=Pedobacter endophyticus TaxID=2789740 RepID=A0A7S9PZV2_9SPHI|nr:porin family protein [Pedobacter endophyticus]QPH40295.1 PorT family protein [Pedobacter endophyticus]
MRKLLTLLLLSGLGVSAQAQEKNSFEFGGHVGLNAATVSSSNAVNSDSRIGFNVTAVGDYFFSDRWSIKAKIGYDQKGWDNGYLENFDTGDTFETDYRTDYITIPVMANWHFGKKRNWYLNFGPYVGILINATETKLGTDFKDFFNTTDIGIDLGIGVKVPVANKLKVLFELDGQAGITDLVRNNQGSTIQNSRSSFNVGLVYGM